MKLLKLLSIIFISVNYFSQPNSKFLDSILKSSEQLKFIISNKNIYQPQIIFTQINRDTSNVPSFKSHFYLVDSSKYFYSASMIKLPTSIFALQKINESGNSKFLPTSIMLTDSSAPCQKNYFTDSSSINKLPSIENYIKRMLLVSDNASYSRLFEFLTPSYYSKQFAKLGFNQALAKHRFDVACVGKGNKYFNQVRFLDTSLNLMYTKFADSINEDKQIPCKNLVFGKTKLSKRKKIIGTAKDFSNYNYLPIKLIHQSLQKLIFNSQMPNPFQLTDNNKKFLVTHLGMYPRESVFPKYDSTWFYDSFKKYFIYGCQKEKINSDSIRIFNIVGRTYGWIADCAYIVDYNTKTEFILTAVIYVNKNNSFGSGKYEYETMGLPFLKELSLKLYSYERQRKKLFLPNLEHLKNFYLPQ